MYHDVSNSKGTCPRGPVQEPVRGASSSWKCVRISATRIQGPVPVQGPEQEDPCRETAKKNALIYAERSVQKKHAQRKLRKQRA